MAVPRVEWECPVCHRHFAIRADIPSPAACPQCSTHGGAALQPTVIAGTGSRHRPESEVDGTIGDSLERNTALEARPSISNGEIYPKQRYRALHVMSFCFKVFAAIAAVAAIAALTLMALAAFRMQNPETRTSAILLHLAEFAGCAFATLALWCFAELIQLLIDIEANTRRRS
jgi:hypothetical protein